LYGSEWLHWRTGSASCRVWLHAAQTCWERMLHSWLNSPAPCSLQVVERKRAWRAAACAVGQQQGVPEPHIPVSPSAARIREQAWCPVPTCLPACPPARLPACLPASRVLSPAHLEALHTHCAVAPFTITAPASMHAAPIAPHSAGSVHLCQLARLPLAAFTPACSLRPTCLPACLQGPDEQRL